MPAFEASGPGSPDVSAQYSHIMFSRPTQPPRAPAQHSLSETTYLEQQDATGLQSPKVPPPPMTAPLSYAPQAATKISPPAYTPQTATEAEPLVCAPQATAKGQPPPCLPQTPADSWLPSYGLFMEDSGKDSRPGTPHDPKHLHPCQFQKEASSGRCSPSGLSLKGVTSLATEGSQDSNSFHPHLGVDTDSNALRRGEPGASRYLKDQLPLLSSVQIEGHPGSLPLHMPSLECSRTDQGLHPWGLLESLVCSEDEGALSEMEAKSQAPGTSEPEPREELDSLFKGLALTVQWEP